MFCRSICSRTFSLAGLVVLTAATFAMAHLHAQSPAETAKIEANLAPESRAVLDRLSTLHELPDGTWKMHAGDLPHAEAVHVIDSDWQPIAHGSAPKETLWFRQTYRVPDSLNGYDLTGARIWFHFNASANGPMPQILYFNGRRVAMGDDLEPVVLFDGARPGERVTVAVKLLHTVDQKTFQGATLKIDFAPNRPSPEDLRLQFLSAAQLVPSLAPNDASPMETLNGAIRLVKLTTLDAANAANPQALSQAQDAFDASLRQAQDKLTALQPLLSHATYHLTGNSHIDAAWLWPWTETVDVVKRTFGTALQLMYEYPQYTYTQSAAAYNEWMAEKYPDMNAEIGQRIKEGRWEIVGGMWVEPDLNLPDGESLVRQLLVGKRWYKQAYGVDVRIGWNPDSFGYTWQLPQIYKKSGVDYFVTQKMTWNDTNQLPFKLFWWESPDGSKVLAYFPHDYANNNLNPVRLAGDLAQARERATGMTDIMDLYGIGDHGGGPTRAILDEGVHWAEPGHVTPKFEFGTAQAYFSSVEKRIALQSPEWNYQSIAKGYTAPPAVPGLVSIPTWKSEMYFEYHRGVMTTQANHKRNMRESSEETLNAEKWASLAWLDGNTYPGTELTEDWKKVLFNQFHDLAAGSGIGVIYKDAQKDYDVVRWSTNQISSTALQSVAERIDTSGAGKPAGSQPVVVFNPLGWTRSGDVVVTVQVSNPGYYSLRAFDVAHGTNLAVQTLSLDKQTGVAALKIHVDDVPALGYKVVSVMPGTAPGQTSHLSVFAREDADNAVLENSVMRLVVDKRTGCITSLFNKHSEFDAFSEGACGNQLQFFKDTPKEYDAWNIDPGTLDVAPMVIEHPDSVSVVKAEDGTPGIRIASHWQSSKFVQTLTLPLGTNIADVENDIDWHETHVLLKAAFPLTVAGPFATYEIPYGTIERPTTRNNSWEKAQFEVPAQRWADLGDSLHGFSLINESKFGYDAQGHLLRLSLLRSPTWPDPDADRGHHHFHYAMYPHSGTWKDALTVRRGWEYNYPLTAVLATAHTGALPASHSFASVTPENLVLTAMKKAEDSNGLIFRAYEWAGKSSVAKFHVPAGATSATVTNMMEVPEGSGLSVGPEGDGKVVTVPIQPYEILTLRVDYPNGGQKE